MNLGWISSLFHRNRPPDAEPSSLRVPCPRCGQPIRFTKAQVLKRAIVPCFSCNAQIQLRSVDEDDSPDETTETYPREARESLYILRLGL